jgi:hypothetical protein
MPFVGRPCYISADDDGNVTVFPAPDQGYVLECGPL